MVARSKALNTKPSELLTGPDPVAADDLDALRLKVRVERVDPPSVIEHHEIAVDVVHGDRVRVG